VPLCVRNFYTFCIAVGFIGSDAETAPFLAAFRCANFRCITNVARSVELCF
jgi:hypothetical protein